MKRSPFFYVVLTLIMAILAILAGVLVASAAGNPCSVTANVGPEWNHVWSSVDCDSSLVAEEWVHYEFGDGQGVDLWVDENGHADDVEHWYPFPGGQFQIEVTRLSNEEFLGSLTLNLFPPTATPTSTEPGPTPTPTGTPLPPMEEIVFLPVILRPLPVPSCSIDHVVSNINHVTFDVAWANAGDAEHVFEFGDGAETLQFLGPNGAGTTNHDYPFPGGTFEVEMTLDGGGFCSDTVVIDWP